LNEDALTFFFLLASGYYDSGRDGHMSRDFLDQGNSRGGGGDRGDGGGGGNSEFFHTAVFSNP
jgi:hypothetical protein